MEYRVEHKRSAQQLEDAVKELIEGGWEPCGGISVVVNPGEGVRMYQAMIRVEGHYSAMDLMEDPY